MASRKTNIEGVGCLKRGGGGAWAVFRFKGGGAWQERGSGVFEWGLIPQCTL